MSEIKSIKKRDGRVVEFDSSKIGEAIFKAASAVGGEDRALATELEGLVCEFISREFEESTPGIEDVQDLVEKVLIETGHAKTAKAYILYRDRRGAAREDARVRSRVEKRDSTDINLLVEGDAVERSDPWDRAKIAKALAREAHLDENMAAEIASAVEKRIIDSGMTSVSTALIRELVDNELFNRGLEAQLEQQAVIGMPKYDLEQLIFSKSKENSNISINNPEAVNLAIAEHTLKQYALQNIFSREVADAHRRGAVHLHDLGYPVRVYCSSHSIEYLKKYGLRLSNLETSSAPAKHARTLTGHLNTFLASMQAYYAGALGVAHINIMFAPLVEGMSPEDMRKEAQQLIFSSSQNAFSRGGQTLFLDFNIHTGIPGHLKHVEAIGPGGKLIEVEDKDAFVKECIEWKLSVYDTPPKKDELDVINNEASYVKQKEDGRWVRTYGSYEGAAGDFTRAMLEVWRAGDENGHPFPFPKCDFHINDESFTDPRQEDLLDFACLIASENGIPYFIFDRDAVTLSACCRLRTKVNDTFLLDHPESLRFCGFQNVTINIPQCALRAGRGNFQGMLDEIEKMMDIAMKAHIEKKEFIATLMEGPGMPLYEIAKDAADGRPYVNLDEATYIIGLIGLNEALKFSAGEELHESNEALMEGLKVIAHMYYKARELGEKYNLKVTLEESPAESAARRLAKVDLRYYPEAKELMKGDVEADDIYYSNSVHLRPDADVDLIERIRKQAMFHSMIESGAIIHAFVGEKRPSQQAIKVLMKNIWDNTQSAQVTISPEFTMCGKCNAMVGGIHYKCPKCGTADLSTSLTNEEVVEDRSLDAFEKILEKAAD